MDIHIFPYFPEQRQNLREKADERKPDFWHFLRIK